MSDLVLAPGTRVEKYRLDRLLGEGGMGVVWAAEHVETSRAVALKFIKQAADGPKSHRRFLQEARASSAVRHPNVVSVLEVIELDDGSPVMVMELLSGESLSDRLRRKHHLALPELADLLVAILSAVGTAHALGIVHRDLKPENIFLALAPDGAEVVKVLDFGIAKITALDGEATRSTGITTTGAVVGTPAYMSPEQVFGEKDIDHRADVWALGLIVYQCLSGTLPTAGDNMGQVLKNVLAKPIEPLERRVADLPAEVSRIVAHMLARDRELRPSDLHEIQEVFGRYTSLTVPSFKPPAGRRARGEKPRATSTPDTFSSTRELETTSERRADRHVSDPEPSATLRLDGQAGRGAAQGEPFTSTLVEARPMSRRVRSWALRAAALAAFAITAGAGGYLWTRAGPVPQPARSTANTTSPLAAPSSVLGCPILRASGVEKPAGWLGAAAAGTACERARVILGGRPERTLIPAELLNLPRQPVDSFPTDPYGQPGARERSLEEARSRAAAYLDGEVVKETTGFLVSLSLEGADGSEMSRAEGRGRELYEAVRAAMDPLVRPDLLPKANELDKAIGEWSRTRDVDSALALLDLTLAIFHNAGSLPDECARFEKQSALLSELGPLERWRCAYVLGLPAPKVELGPSDPSSPAALATKIRVEHIVNRSDTPASAEVVHGLFERDTTPWGRSLLAATESCLLQSFNPGRAYEMALVAVQAEPKNPDGQWCNPWEQLLTVTQDTSSMASAVRAVQAWVPWEGNGWMMQGIASSDAQAALPYLRRAYSLTPFNTQVVDALAGRLLAAGEREEARGIALAVVSGGYPVHRMESDLLLLRIDASEARFGAALARLLNPRTTSGPGGWTVRERGALEVTAEDAGWVRAQRFAVAWRALELAGILGRATELADLVVQRFIEPEPPPFDGSALSTPARLPAICALASAPVSSRCFSRLRALRGRLSAGITAGTDAFASGAERYARGDFQGAAKTWRSLLRQPGSPAAVMPDMMAETFDRTGDVELAERVDAAVLLRAGEFNGASPAHVRAARRAAARGDLEGARQLARKVIEAWSVADETVPAVEEMRRLLAQLR